jgi:hypothetical protein
MQITANSITVLLQSEWGNDAEMNVSPHDLIKAEAYEWVVRTIFFRGPESA